MSSPDDLSSDEVISLAKQMAVVISQEPCYLSDRQEEWAIDLAEQIGKQNYRGVNERSIGFMWQIVRGDYADCH